MIRLKLSLFIFINININNMFKILNKNNLNHKKKYFLPTFVKDFDNRNYNHIIIYNPINKKKEIFILK
jgi:hypothetical protein